MDLKFCQTQNKASKVCLRFLKVCPSGEISPNLVTLIVINKTSACISMMKFQVWLHGQLLLQWHNGHLDKKTAHWPGLPVFVDSSSYVASHHKTSFGAECEASVLICPRIQCHCPGGSSRPTNYGQ